MVDRLTITLNNLECDFSACERQGKSYNSEVYRLYSPKPGEGPENYLLLKYKPHRKILTFEKRSLRKWYLGEYTMEDLSFRTFTEAIAVIADKLNVDVIEFAKKGKVTRCEIGLNIKTRVPCDKIIESVMGYSSLKWYRYEYETVGFKGEDKELKMYNKPVELLANNKKDIPLSSKNELQRLTEEGKHFLRVEFTLYDKKSFDNHKLSNISTVGDLIGYYEELYEFWAREVERIIFLPRLIYDEEMTPNEYMLARLLSIDGLQQLEAECEKRWARSSQRTKFLNKAKEVMKRYQAPDAYDKEEFYRDVEERCMEIKAEDQYFRPENFIKSLRNKDSVLIERKSNP